MINRCISVVYCIINYQMIVGLMIKDCMINPSMML